KRTLAHRTSHSRTRAWHGARRVEGHSGLDELAVCGTCVRFGRAVEARDETEQCIAREERFRCPQIGARPIAAPAPLGRMGAKASANWIEYDVPACLEEGTVRNHLSREKTTAKDVVAAAVKPIRPPTEAPVELGHSLREPVLGDSDDEVIVVRHQTPGVDDPFVLVDAALE